LAYSAEDKIICGGWSKASLLAEIKYIFHNHLSQKVKKMHTKEAGVGEEYGKLGA
jgi:hypothetical protein